MEFVCVFIVSVGVHEKTFKKFPHWSLSCLLASETNPQPPPPISLSPPYYFSPSYKHWYSHLLPSHCPSFLILTSPFPDTLPTHPSPSSPFTQWGGYPHKWSKPATRLLKQFPSLPPQAIERSAVATHPYIAQHHSIKWAQQDAKSYKTSSMSSL